MAKMENMITYDSRPELNNVILIVGLPGVGNVGKIAADFIGYKMEAKRFATFLSSDLPPQVFIDDKNMFYPATNDIWYIKDVKGHDILLLLGEFQASTPQGQFELCKYIFEKIIRYDPKLVITLGGYGLGQVVESPRVLGVTNDEKLQNKLRKAGVTFSPGEPQGGIVGAAAMFIAFANEYDIDAACLMGETSGFLVDHKSGERVVECLCKFLGMKIDTSEMQTDINQIDMINTEVQAMAETSPEDLSYFR